MSRVSLRRTPRARLTYSVDDFSREGSASPIARPIVASVLVGLMGVGVAAGVITASASHGTEQSTTSMVVNTQAPDISKATPVDESLTAEQAAKQADVNAPKTSTDGGLSGAFGTRANTTNVNSVRSSLSQSITSRSNSDRSQQLENSSQKIQITTAQAEQKKREEVMAADIAKVKAEATRIAEEKKRAEELLKSLAKAPGANTAGVNLGDLSSIVSSGGGSMPVPAGSATLGAHFGQYGSWSRYHTGQDFPAPSGTPIYAAASGVVGNSTGASGWAGNYVVIHHANGGSTLYAHMSAKVAQPGQVVKAGQLIGYVGNTGRSFGAHLHFEYYPPGTTPGDVYSASDPMAFLRSLGVRA